LHRGDAIGDSARLMRDALRAWGHEADIYALELDDDLRDDGRHWRDWRPSEPGDVVLLHYALPSPLTAALCAERGRRVLLHHNITPPEFFERFDPELARICALGRAQLATLVGQVELALGDSEFNRRELQAAGFTRTGVLPIYLDFTRYREPDGWGGTRPRAGQPVLRRQLDDGLTNVLFVGRVAPNKCHEDLLRLVAYWKRFVSPDVRLLLVGKLPRRRHYFDALQALFHEQGLSAAEVVFMGHVSHEELLACYRAARVFVSMSAHEGFGVPLVEAMLMDVPILAYAAAAVPDTLGGAGVQFDRKRLPELAELAQALARDEPLRARVLAGQRRRLAAFDPAAIEASLRGYLETL
jgi:glycosyltransferase involved in cell wall biosynthesis